LIKDNYIQATSYLNNC